MANKYNEGKYVCKLSPELQERAKKELNEDPNRREEAIEILRQWIVKQPHINGRTDDAFLLRFLRNAKFSIERAKQKYENFYTMTTAIPEWFSGLDLNDLKFQKLLKAGLFLPLGYDKEGRYVLLGRTGCYDPSEIKWDDIMRLNVVLSEWLLWDEQTQICGTVFLNDMSNISGGHVAQFTPMVIKKAMSCWQDCYPMRTKALHYWKPPSFFEKVFSLFRVFMKEKMKRRVQIHGSNLESLHESFPLEILPKEYGGLAGDIETVTANIMKELMAHREFFIENEKYKVDESKRPGKPKTHEDLFGIDGTFRKLDID